MYIYEFYVVLEDYGLDLFGTNSVVFITIYESSEKP